MTHLQSFLLMSQPAQGGGGGWSMMLMLGAIIVIFYFFMIRPQQKKQKQMTSFREGLKRGDKIVTIGGLHGKITDVQEDTFIIEVEDGTKIRIEKAAVAIDPKAPTK